MLKIVYLLYTICILLCIFVEKVSPEVNYCLDTRLKAAVSASYCCTLVKPTLDKGYNDCTKELLPSLPKDRPLSRAEKLAINICVEECNYIGNGYIDATPPYNLDLENIEENIEKFMPEPKDTALAFIVKAYKRCQQFCEKHRTKIDITFPDIDIIDRMCSAYAMRITTCVRIIAMQECPPEFYTNTTECAEGQKFFKDCITAITDE